MKAWGKNILMGAAVAAIGLLLFLLAFLLLAAVTSWAEARFPAGSGVDVHHRTRVGLLILTVLLLLPVLKSRLPDLLKASYLTLPLMASLVMLGITLYARPAWMAWASGAAVIAAALAWALARKRPRVYAFAVLFVAALALYAQLSGMQI